MNDKIKAILLNIIIGLKPFGWKLQKDYELTLQSDGFYHLINNLPVEGDSGNKTWQDTQEVDLELKLESDDQITHYPDFNVSTEFFIQGGNIDRIENNFDSDISFTDKEVQNREKALLVAKKINGTISAFIQSEYHNYVDNNAQDMEDYNSGGYKADDDAYFNR